MNRCGGAEEKSGTSKPLEGTETEVGLATKVCVDTNAEGSVAD
jgi:hypothetical protein